MRGVGDRAVVLTEIHIHFSDEITSRTSGTSLRPVAMRFARPVIQHYCSSF